VTTVTIAGGRYWIGGWEERFRHLDAERLGGLEVDDQLEFAWLQDRQLGGLGALEDVARIDANLAKTVGKVGSVASSRPKNFRVVT
jgi:hypothetical protein